VLIFDVIGRHGMVPRSTPPAIGAEDHRILLGLGEVSDALCADNLLETYHDALLLHDEAVNSFALGYVDLVTRGRADDLFLHICGRIQAHVRDLEEVPEELADLDRDLADTYYGNFSVFQSAPDHWAVQQLFPVMPIQRLGEEPTRRAVFADLTCDSDGKIDLFIDPDGAKPVLELHALNGEPYYVGVFLAGAYQEILGDLHNLFGDTDAVHLRLDNDGLVAVEHVVDGDSVAEVLSYVQYDRPSLVDKVRRTIEKALRSGEIGLSESALLRKRYEQGLLEYTYLSHGDR
jgi:arginine decarboxylase